MTREPHFEIIVYLLRHGQTELNAAGRLRGRVDVPLDERGLKQAEALGLLFKGVPLAAGHRQSVAASCADRHATRANGGSDG